MLTDITVILSVLVTTDYVKRRKKPTEYFDHLIFTCPYEIYGRSKRYTLLPTVLREGVGK